MRAAPSPDTSTLPTDGDHASSLRSVTRRYAQVLASLALLFCLAVACLTTGGGGRRDGDEIVVCGEYVDIGTRVVLWSDPFGYDAYSEVPRFAPPESGPDGQPVRKKRYGDRGGAPAGAWTRDELAERVDQFVVHFDVCGTSRRCFQILQDKRNLSVHFLLDVDGTIYQTLDLKERAWHATIANDRSVGIEIAHIGAYPAPGHPVMRSWYAKDEAGLRIAFPAVAETGVRTKGFVARPASNELFEGEINGDRVWMHDYTKEQHEALARLTAALSRVFPSLALEVPRDAAGKPLARALTADEFASFRGVLGHYHVQTNKNDPGPALVWDDLLRRARDAMTETR
ncbi:MAG: N-acetylmuramoyl-L-alanine amidase [Planctomycetes bacterium]|nr:N-acetylmuramoyl-L-alanine amidase [Planctomycetota bacterium]